MFAADTITKGQTFKTATGTFTAIADAKADRLNARGGWKVLVTDGAEEFFHLFGLTDMVKAA